MSRRRFLPSLVVVLFLSTLALANSIPVNLILHSGTGVHGAFTVSINRVKTTPMNFEAVSSHTSGWNAHLNGLSSGRVMLSNGTATRTGRVVLPGRGYDPSCCKAQNWVGGDQAPHATTPEPGSLILLSTGLIGIAGTIRRKLRG